MYQLIKGAYTQNTFEIYQCRSHYPQERGVEQSSNAWLRCNRAKDMLSLGALCVSSLHTPITYIFDKEDITYMSRGRKKM